jgi:ubiquinone/menaquinone biosynthesis C-methylase UbiE
LTSKPPSVSEERLVILDVGCGNVPNGHVNLDLFYYGKGNNFVVGEAHHLPFKDHTFIKVYSKHCLEHLENPLAFFKEAKRVLIKGGTLECVYPTDSMLTKKTMHNLLNMQWSSAFKWKGKVTGKAKINYGGHKWQIIEDRVHKLLLKAGFEDINFHKIHFPTIRVDKDTKKIKWKMFLNAYLPKWQIETKFTAKTRSD